MQYRRANVKGGSYFFTVNLADRKSNLLLEYIDDFKDVIRFVKQKHPFLINAMVVMPDHLHTIWTLPKFDANFSKHWMLIKSGFSRRVPKNEYRSKSRIDKGERGIWQRRYWEHLTCDERDFETHVNYIHYNPVKHGYVTKPMEWEYSSIHRYIMKGVIARNWGSADLSDGSNFGERIE